MNRRLIPLAIGMAVLYAALAVGAANCLVLHSEQPSAHHHSQSHVAHSALCAWACQIHPSVVLPAAVPLMAVTAVSARLHRIGYRRPLSFPTTVSSSRAPPR